MWDIWSNLLLPKALKSCQKSNKSPNLVTLDKTHDRVTDESVRHFQATLNWFKEVSQPNGTFTAYCDLFSSFRLFAVNNCWTVVVVVKWSACSPSTQMIRVWITLTPPVFSCKIVFEKMEKINKEAGNGLLRNFCYCLIKHSFCYT